MKSLLQIILLSLILLPICFCQEQSVLAQTNNNLKKENKILSKEFGFQLPETAIITNKLITHKSKVTFLFIKIPVAELEKFKASFFLQAKNTEGRVVHSGELIGWLPGYNMDDVPEGFVDNWKKTNQLNLGVLARILILEKSNNSKSGKLTQEVSKSNFAVLLVDSQKGFMEIRYTR